MTQHKCLQPGTRDGSKSFFASPSQVTSHLVRRQVQVKSQVISVQVQVKSQVIWSDVKSSQVTSHLVQTQVKSQVSLSKYKSSRT